MKTLPSPSDMVFAKFNPLSNMTNDQPGQKRGRKKQTARVATSAEALDLARQREEKKQQRLSTTKRGRGRPKKETIAEPSTSTAATPCPPRPKRQCIRMIQPDSDEEN